MKKGLLADGSYEELPQELPTIRMPVFLKKWYSAPREALAPATRGRGSYLLLNFYKENAHPLIDVYEGKISWMNLPPSSIMMT